MDGLTFVTTMTGALAWPIIALVIALLFRSPLVALLPLVREVAYGRLNVKFERELSKAAEQIDRAAPTVVPVPGLRGDEQPAGAPTDDRLAMLASLSPRAAILQAWIEVEQAMHTATGVAFRSLRNCIGPEESTEMWQGSLNGCGR